MCAGKLIDKFERLARESWSRKGVVAEGVVWGLTKKEQ